jgi:hypothetical protein
MKVPGELWIVARSLGDIVEEVVFVGGMVRELLITDPAAGSARPTRDVDCIVNALSSVDYMLLGERLRKNGFAVCTDEDAPICRWVIHQIRVDVMPIDPAILGFSNVWYPSAIEHAVRIAGSGANIRIVDAVHFCATKIESFLGRGEDDFFHHDMEDLIAIVDGRAELLAEINRAPEDVRKFIAEQIEEWLNSERFLNSLAGHLEGDAASQARRPALLARLRELASSVQATGHPRQIGLPVPVRPAPESLLLAARQSAGARPFRPGTAISPAGASRLGASFPVPASVLLRSTNLREAAYDSNSHVLTIEFVTGRVYTYDGVPQNVYVGLVQAGSHGKYFNQWIRDRYQHHRLR